MENSEKKKKKPEEEPIKPKLLEANPVPSLKRTILDAQLQAAIERLQRKDKGAE